MRIVLRSISSLLIIILVLESTSGANVQLFPENTVKRSACSMLASWHEHDVSTEGLRVSIGTEFAEKKDAADGHLREPIVCQDIPSVLCQGRQSVRVRSLFHFLTTACASLFSALSFRGRSVFAGIFLFVCCMFASVSEGSAHTIVHSGSVYEVSVGEWNAHDPSSNTLSGIARDLLLLEGYESISYADIQKTIDGIVSHDATLSDQNVLRQNTVLRINKDIVTHDEGEESRMHISNVIEETSSVDRHEINLQDSVHATDQCFDDTVHMSVDSDTEGMVDLSVKKEYTGVVQKEVMYDSVIGDCPPMSPTIIDCIMPVSGTVQLLLPERRRTFHAYEPILRVFDESVEKQRAMMAATHEIEMLEKRMETLEYDYQHGLISELEYLDIIKQYAIAKGRKAACEKEQTFVLSFPFDGELMSDIQKSVSLACGARIGSVLNYDKMRYHFVLSDEEREKVNAGEYPHVYAGGQEIPFIGHSLDEDGMTVFFTRNTIVSADEPEIRFLETTWHVPDQYNGALPVKPVRVTMPTVSIRSPFAGRVIDPWVIYEGEHVGGNSVAVFGLDSPEMEQEINELRLQIAHQQKILPGLKIESQRAYEQGVLQLSRWKERLQSLRVAHSRLSKVRLDLPHGVVARDAVFTKGMYITKDMPFLEVRQTDLITLTVFVHPEYAQKCAVGDSIPVLVNGETAVLTGRIVSIVQTQDDIMGIPISQSEITISVDNAAEIWVPTQALLCLFPDINDMALLSHDDLAVEVLSVFSNIHTSIFDAKRFDAATLLHVARSGRIPYEGREMAVLQMRDNHAFSDIIMLVNDMIGSSSYEDKNEHEQRFFSFVIRVMAEMLRDTDMSVYDMSLDVPDECIDTCLDFLLRVDGVTYYQSVAAEIRSAKNAYDITARLLDRGGALGICAWRLSVDASVQLYDTYSNRRYQTSVLGMNYDELLNEYVFLAYMRSEEILVHPESLDDDFFEMLSVPVYHECIPVDHHTIRLSGHSNCGMSFGVSFSSTAYVREDNCFVTDGSTVLSRELYAHRMGDEKYRMNYVNECDVYNSVHIEKLALLYHDMALIHDDFVMQRLHDLLYVRDICDISVITRYISLDGTTYDSDRIMTLRAFYADMLRHETRIHERTMLIDALCMTYVSEIAIGEIVRALPSWMETYGIYEDEHDMCMDHMSFYLKKAILRGCVEVRKNMYLSDQGQRYSEDERMHGIIQSERLLDRIRPLSYSRSDSIRLVPIIDDANAIDLKSTEIDRRVARYVSENDDRQPFDYWHLFGTWHIYAGVFSVVLLLISASVYFFRDRILVHKENTRHTTLVHGDKSRDVRTRTRSHISLRDTLLSKPIIAMWARSKSPGWKDFLYRYDYEKRVFFLLSGLHAIYNIGYLFLLFALYAGMMHLSWAFLAVVCAGIFLKVEMDREWTFLHMLLNDKLPEMFKIEIRRIIHGVRSVRMNTLNALAGVEDRVAGTYGMAKSAVLALVEHAGMVLSTFVSLLFFDGWMAFAYACFAGLIGTVFCVHIRSSRSIGQNGYDKEHELRQWKSRNELVMSLGLETHHMKYWDEKVKPVMHMLIRQKARYMFRLRLLSVIIPFAGYLTGYLLPAIILVGGIEVLFFLAELEKTIGEGVFAEKSLYAFSQDAIAFHENNDTFARAGAQGMHRVFQTLMLEDLTIANTDGIVITKVNESVSAGEMVFIGGVSGAGKTSLLLALSHKDKTLITHGTVSIIYASQNDGLQALSGSHDVRTSVRYYTSEWFKRIFDIEDLQTLIDEEDDQAKREKYRSIFEHYARLYVPRYDVARSATGRHAATLSSGEKARLVLAFIFAMNGGDVLLLDQPLSGYVDEDVERECLLLLKEEARKQRRVIMVADPVMYGQAPQYYDTIFDRQLYIVDKKLVSRDMLIGAEKHSMRMSDNYSFLLRSA